MKNRRFLNLKAVWLRFLAFWAVVGPGLITGVADDDAGGIATYSLTGALYGYDLLWTLIPVTILLIATMEMSARLGAVTGQGLADLIREKFGVKVTFWMLLLVFLANLGTIVSEFSGIASSIEILGSATGYVNVFVWLKYLLVPLLAYGLWKVITEYDYKRVEKFFLFLILFYAAYPISAYMAGPNWNDALKALVVPTWRFNAGYFFMMIGLIGTTITPWMHFYIQSTVIEKGITLKDYDNMKWEVILGCTITDIISFFIIVACAVTLYFTPGVPPVSTVEDIGRALVPFAGGYAGYLFALGLFNASLFGAAILPLSTAFAICEGMGWERGLNKTYDEAPWFYWIFTFSLVAGAVVVLLPGFSFLYLAIMRISQVAQGLILPPFLYLLIKLDEDRSLLGEYVNSVWLSRFLWVAFAVLTVIDILLLLSTLKEIAGF